MKRWVVVVACVCVGGGVGVSKEGNFIGRNLCGFGADWVKSVYTRLFFYIRRWEIELEVWRKSNLDSLFSVILSAFYCCFFVGVVHYFFRLFWYRNVILPFCYGTFCFWILEMDKKQKKKKDRAWRSTNIFLYIFDYFWLSLDFPRNDCYRKKSNGGKKWRKKERS